MNNGLNPCSNCMCFVFGFYFRAVWCCVIETQPQPRKQERAWLSRLTQPVQPCGLTFTLTQPKQPAKRHACNLEMKYYLNKSVLNYKDLQMKKFFLNSPI